MTSHPFPIRPCPTAELSFDTQGNAYCENYTDIYFQPSIGLAEKKHVFLSGNQLPEKWLHKAQFCIGETGFGTGLNFLNTLKLWHETAKPTQHLDYISCELHPLNQAQIQQTLSQFPQLNPYATALIHNYPKFLIYGVHRINFEAYNVSLTLILADCVAAFENIQQPVDAWFLDGFSPSKNPAMWSLRLFKAMACLSHKHTTLATYSVAGEIRKGLSSVGFEVEKTAGFGQKREMLRAQFQQQHNTVEKQPWATTFASDNTTNIIVLGAGIAGLSVADKLQKAGNNVTLIDRQKTPCLETSGNPQAMIMPALTLNDSPEARFYLAAFIYALSYYRADDLHKDGVLELAFSVPQKKWQQSLLQRFALPSDLVQAVSQGLLYPHAGWLDTQGHAQHIFASLPDYRQAEIQSIVRDKQQWRLTDAYGKRYQADTLVIANGINHKKLLANYVLPTTAKFGEISYVASKNLPAQLADCRHVQLNKGYITPQWHGQQTFGASFEAMQVADYLKPVQISATHWQKNQALWDNTDYAELIKHIPSHQARAGIRVTTPDHLPICGPVINQQQFRQDYHDIRHGKQWKSYPSVTVQPNLYVFTGLGSRGFTSAPLLAEFLCNQILGQCLPLDKHMQKTVHPNRFLYKSLWRETD